MIDRIEYIEKEHLSYLDYRTTLFDPLKPPPGFENTYQLIEKYAPEALEEDFDWTYAWGGDEGADFLKTKAKGLNLGTRPYAHVGDTWKLTLVLKLPEGSTDSLKKALSPLVELCYQYSLINSILLLIESEKLDEGRWIVNLEVILFLASIWPSNDIKCYRDSLEHIFRAYLKSGAHLSYIGLEWINHFNRKIFLNYKTLTGQFCAYFLKGWEEGFRRDVSKYSNMVEIFETIELQARVFEKRVSEPDPSFSEILDPVRSHIRPFRYDETQYPAFNIFSGAVFNAYRSQYALRSKNNLNHRFIAGGLPAVERSLSSPDTKIITLIDIYLRTQSWMPIRVLDKNFLIEHECLEKAGPSQIIIVEYVPDHPLRKEEYEKESYVIRYGWEEFINQMELIFEDLAIIFPYNFDLDDLKAYWRENSKTEIANLNAIGKSGALENIDLPTYSPKSVFLDKLLYNAENNKLINYPGYKAYYSLGAGKTRTVLGRWYTSMRSAYDGMRCGCQNNDPFFIGLFNFIRSAESVWESYFFTHNKCWFKGGKLVYPKDLGFNYPSNAIFPGRYLKAEINDFDTLQTIYKQLFYENSNLGSNKFFEVKEIKWISAKSDKNSDQE